MVTYRVFVASLLMALPSWAVHADDLTDYFPPPESKGGWRTLLPEDAVPAGGISEVPAGSESWTAP